LAGSGVDGRTGHDKALVLAPRRQV